MAESVNSIRFNGGMWSSPPIRSWEADGLLHVEARPFSDFWRDPRNGSHSDNGHLLAFTHSTDVCCQIEVGGDVTSEYDQCGLMLRTDPEHWVKVALDIVDGQPRIATVVTNGYSDSALQPHVGDVCRLRLSRIGMVVVVEACSGLDGRFELIRMARLPTGEAFQMGPMCCSPSRSGFIATFGSMAFGSPPKDLIV